MRVCVRLLSSVLVFSLFSCALSGLVPLPRAHAHTTVAVPLRGFGGSESEPPPIQRLIFLADTGHAVSRSATSLCAQIEEAFREGSVSAAQCAAVARDAVRAARGLAVQHDAPYAAAVTALESYLGEEGYSARDWEGSDDTWRRPFRAKFLSTLVARVVKAPPSAAHAGSAFAPARVRNICVAGCGAAGHTTLALLVAGGGGSADGASSKVRVFSFDRSTGRASIPADDYMGAHFAERSFIFLGDPPEAMARFKAAFPDALCDVLVIDPHALQRLEGNKTAQVLRALAGIAAPDHVLAIMGGGGRNNNATAPPGAVWEAAAAAGWLSWEGTLLESPDAPDGDAVLYGAFATDALEIMKTARLPVEAV